MQRFNIRAVAIGSLVMLAIDILTGIVSFTFFAGDSLTAGATQDEISAVAKVIEQNGDYHLCRTIPGMSHSKPKLPYF